MNYILVLICFKENMNVNNVYIIIIIIFESYNFFISMRNPEILRTLFAPQRTYIILSHVACIVSVLKTYDTNMIVYLRLQNIF